MTEGIEGTAERHPGGAEGTAPAAATIAETLAQFAAELRFEDLPRPVIERAKLHILDALGCGLASTRFPFAETTLKGLAALAGAGDFPVIGMRARLPLRDAAIMNGVLVHGLDYDDTHMAGVIHGSASAVPTVLAQAQRVAANGRDLLLAYLIAIESGTRIALAAKGAFHQVGFHPTGVVGVFACALAAGRLSGLGRQALVRAQGIALSQASGTFEFLDEGAWTKRLHPGWAAAAGLSAAALAGAGFAAPSRAYEGRFGLYRCYLGAEPPVDWAACTAGLGRDFEMLRVALKPYPSCHFNHAFADAALALKRAHDLTPDDIEEIVALIGEGAVKTVAEPEDRKRRPENDYEARFSLHYTIAAALARGRFTLAEFKTDCLTDPSILGLCRRIRYAIDPASAFPRYYSGEIVIRTKDGRELRHREEVNRGADTRPLSAEETRAKFLANGDGVLSRDRLLRIIEALDGLDRADARAAELGPLLAP